MRVRLWDGTGMTSVFWLREKGRLFAERLEEMILAIHEERACTAWSLSPFLKVVMRGFERVS
jgi:hypothetical protein